MGKRGDTIRVLKSMGARPAKMVFKSSVLGMFNDSDRGDLIVEKLKNHGLVVEFDEKLKLTQYGRRAAGRL